MFCETEAEAQRWRWEKQGLVLNRKETRDSD